MYSAGLFVNSTVASSIVLSKFEDNSLVIESPTLLQFSHSSAMYLSANNYTIDRCSFFSNFANSTFQSASVRTTSRGGKISNSLFDSNVIEGNDGYVFYSDTSAAVIFEGNEMKNSRTWNGTVLRALGVHSS